MKAQAVENEIQQILEKRARDLAAQKTDIENDEYLELAAFRVGEERYAVSTFLIHEVQPLGNLKWSQVPGAPNFIIGVVNLRGRLYSLMDLGNYFGLAPREIPATACVLRVSGGALGDGTPLELCLLADDLPQVVQIHQDELHPAPASLSSKAQEVVRGVTSEMLVVLDLERLLSDPDLIVHAEV